MNPSLRPTGHTDDQREPAATRRDDDGVQRDLRGDERDVAGVRRDAAAGRRDRAAALRDGAAEQRDAAARLRDRSAQRRDESATSYDASPGACVAPESARRAAAARAYAATDRRASALDRRAAARERREAELIRRIGLADRVSGAGDRADADLDRTDAMSDRDASAVERDFAGRDHLTGAQLRATGFTALKNEMARARRTQQTLTIAFVDVDGLKAINDFRGHAAGDRVLVEVATLLQATLRPYDLVIRFGGDEFVAAMSGFSHADAQTRFDVVNQLLALAEEPASVSVGLAEMEPDDLLEMLIGRADAALLRGRDRVEAT